MSDQQKKHISIVAPCYNEREVIDTFLDRLAAVADSMESHSFEFLFVDDGSVDGTQEKVAEKSKQDPRIKLIELSKNFGQQQAITAGLDFCTGDYIVVIDADLQDPPELIPDMISELEAGADTVHAVRESRREDSICKRTSARLFYWGMRRFASSDLPHDSGDFKAFNRNVLEALRQHKERVRFLRGIIPSLGFKQTEIGYIRDPRYAGKSKYPASKVIKLAGDAITSFSMFPLRLLLFAGIITLAAWLIFCIIAVATSYTNPPGLEKGFAILTALILGFSGIILLGLGILGEYIGRMMIELKGRPIYVVKAKHNIQE